jgi:hypothetical protein
MSLRDPFETPDVRRLMVFGHPAHELAVFGVLQRYRPSIVIITDGGSPSRLEQSRIGLASIGLLGHATFLNYTESSFYKALIEGDVALFDDVAQRLRSVVGAARPEQVFCDAIEFYNPVHDITLPIVRAALDGRAGTEIFEIPLVYQKDEPGEVYEIQRLPIAYENRRIVHHLTPAELDCKVEARDRIYTSLHDQAGPEFRELSHGHLSREELASAGPGLPSPRESGRALRYEWRARLLRAQGLIESEITFARHYLPLAAQLAAAGDNRAGARMAASD